jgi:hypothetical protein
MDQIPQTKSQSPEGMGIQNFTRIALVGGVCAILGWLMAHLQPLRRRFRWYLGITFLAYLAPTILALLDA